MDLNLILWAGGMLFSLGIFAVKVGVGLRWGRITPKGIGLTLMVYLTLFAVIAWAADWLSALIAPLLRQGPWGHVVMAAGLFIWGLVVLLKESRQPLPTPEALPTGPAGAALLLILPCPFCLSAMTVAITAALPVFKAPPILLGLGLGTAFSLLVLLTAFLCQARSDRSLIPLGLGMITVALYFGGALVLPGKIEAARALYAAIEPQNPMGASQDELFVPAFLALLLLAGFIAGNLNRSRS